jgi:two-component system chemotaxis sensor kinase CheA
MLSDAPRAVLEAHFRYVSEQVSFEDLAPAALAPPSVAPAPAVDGRRTAAQAVLSAQAVVLGLPDQVDWLPGRLKAVAAALDGCLSATDQDVLRPALAAALERALQQDSGAALARWLDESTPRILAGTGTGTGTMAVAVAGAAAAAAPFDAPPTAPCAAEAGDKLQRRSDDLGAAPTTLKVEQEKIDRLMGLIGEMVVAKNALPYLAARAETVYGVRELAREIKARYAVINRVAEDMQDAIMQVRMMPVSFVFQRFPRLVRDISRKLGKEVELVLEGEGTAADKNIIEALADPLIHILRNSLDHGLETPDARLAAGKPAAGRLLIRAAQVGDRVVIEVCDDGRGIDPAVIKRKALEKGVIDLEQSERLSDQDAINLVFAAGFSTVDVVSDLSGRGVGMDVVRAKVAQVGGSVSLASRPGEGTQILLSLPLSMAVSNVMIVESGEQSFGIPMDMVVETVRVAGAEVHAIQRRESTVLRGQIVPLCTLNSLLASGRPQRLNDQGELAILVVRLRGEQVGLVVDHFRGVVDIILKPLGGILGSLPGYAGCALLGDGSVLMVLNPGELM